MKILQEIQTEHGRNASEIMNSYLDTIDEIRAQKEPEAGGYLNRLTDDQRLDLLREQKTRRADEAHGKTLEAYTAEVERDHNKLAQRPTHLKHRLFSVEGPDGAPALSRSVTATEGELSAYLDIAEQASNTDLARAVFVAAERRDLGDLMHRSFVEVNQEAGTLYQEWAEMPSQDVLERQQESIERVAQPPNYNRLMPYAQATT